MGLERALILRKVETRTGAQYNAVPRFMTIDGLSYPLLSSRTIIPKSPSCTLSEQEAYMNKDGRTLTKGRLGHQASAGGRGACIIRTLTLSLATVRFRGGKANKLTVCGFDVSMYESFPFGRTGIYNAAILHEACCSCHRLESRPYEARWYMTTELSAQPLLLIVCI